MKTCTYRILRYTPNLIRDEWVNIGILFHDLGAARLEFRAMDEPAEFARLRRLHADAEESIVRGLQAEFAARLQYFENDPEKLLAHLDDTLSNVLQLSPPRAVLTENPAAELARLYDAHVAPPRLHRAAASEPGSRGNLRFLATNTFRTAGILERLERGLRVAEYTFAGDTMRFDFAYRRNGTRGFVQVLPLLRDAAQVKALAFTADAIRSQMAAEFHAVTENEPPAAGRYQETASFLRIRQIEVVPLAELESFATRLRSWLN